MGSVRELLDHLKDDPQLQPLLDQLGELASRVQAAADQSLELQGKPHAGHQEQPRNFAKGSHTIAADGQQTSGGRLEDLARPLPPAGDSSYAALPVPVGGHEWAALQGPVNEACCHFNSPAAKAAWKQWSLIPGNVRLVVAVAWWTVAHVFQPGSQHAAAVQEYVFQQFSQQYTRHVLTYQGAGKDLYHRLWQVCIASAAVELLRGACPRSSHKLDAALVTFVYNQLVRWTAGLLPADLHPSDHELVGQAPPAAYTHVKHHTGPSQAMPAANAARSISAGTQGSSGLHGSRYSGIAVVGSLEPHGQAGALCSNGLGYMTDTGASAAAGRCTQPYSTTVAAASSLLMPPQGDAGVSFFGQAYSKAAAGLAGGGIFSSAPELVAEPTPTVLITTPQSPGSRTDGHACRRGTGTLAPVEVPSGGTLRSATGAECLLPSSVQCQVPAFQLEQSSPAVMHLFKSHKLGRPRQQQGADPGVMAHTFGAGQRSRRRPLDTAAPLPQHAQDKGVGQPQQDEVSAGPAAEQPVFMYSSLAKDSRQRAADAVARYQACKAEARKEVAAMKKQWVCNRSALQAHVAELVSSNAAKGMSDRLSNWIESDMDRLLRAQPPATTHMIRPAASELSPRSKQTAAVGARKPAGRATTATEAVLQAKGGASTGAAALAGAVIHDGQAGYLGMTAATLAGAGCASASFLAAAANSTSAGRGPSKTRIMEPWSKMRAVETRIRNALSQAQHGTSNDIAARLAVQELQHQARDRQPGLPGNGLQGAAWKPVPLQYTRGTRDVRLHTEAHKYMRGMELECYNV